MRLRLSRFYVCVCVKLCTFWDREWQLWIARVLLSFSSVHILLYFRKLWDLILASYLGSVHFSSISLLTCSECMLHADFISRIHWASFPGNWFYWHFKVLHRKCQILNVIACCMLLWVSNLLAKYWFINTTLLYIQIIEFTWQHFS